MPFSSAERSLQPARDRLMLMLCVSWGFNQIAVKLALPDISPLLQGTIRSVAALPVLLLIARFRGVNIFTRDGTLHAGLCAGVLFGVEFVLIYRGLQLTSASRAVVFLYTAPFFVALGSYRLLGERLRVSQWAGLGLVLSAWRSRSVFRRPMSMPTCSGRPSDRRRRARCGRHDPDGKGHASSVTPRRKRR